jgi:hypothetical protein
MTNYRRQTYKRKQLQDMFIWCGLLLASLIFFVESFIYAMGG